MAGTHCDADEDEDDSDECAHIAGDDAEEVAADQVAAATGGSTHSAHTEHATSTDSWLTTLSYTSQRMASEKGEWMRVRVQRLVVVCTFRLVWSGVRLVCIQYSAVQGGVVAWSAVRCHSHSSSAVRTVGRLWLTAAEVLPASHSSLHSSNNLTRQQRLTQTTLHPLSAHFDPLPEPCWCQHLSVRGSRCP